jgi:hypothetical protein
MRQHPLPDRLLGSVLGSDRVGIRQPAHLATSINHPAGFEIGRAHGCCRFRLTQEPITCWIRLAASTSAAACEVVSALSDCALACAMNADRVSAASLVLPAASNVDTLVSLSSRLVPVVESVAVEERDELVRLLGGPAHVHGERRAGTVPVADVHAFGVEPRRTALNQERAWAGLAWESTG